MVKDPIYWLQRFCLILLLGGLWACSTEDPLPPEPPIPPVEEPIYFLSATDSLRLNRSTWAERLDMDGQTALLALLPNREIRVDAIRYRTEAPNGEEVEATGIITYPTDHVFKGVVVGLHYSIGAEKETPSAQMAQIETALAMFGYVVVCPDYLGFGPTKDKPQTYIHAQTTGQNAVDMLLASREYMEQEGRPIDHTVSVVGYSQGGYSALAFTKMAEEQYTEEIKLKKVFAGGGPYEPVSMFDYLLEHDELENPSTILLTILGLDYGDQLGLDYSKVLIEPALSNYKEWCISKNYTLGQINRQLGTNKLTKILHPDAFTTTLNSEWKKIYASLTANSLTTGWTPKVPLLLVHGTKDSTVPFINSQTAYDQFKARGADVELRSYPSGHEDTAITFYIAVLQYFMF